MERKTKRLWIRISPEDEALFKRKVANYKSVSAMIRAAVNQLDDTATQGKIAAIHQLHDFYQRYQQQLSSTSLSLVVVTSIRRNNSWRLPTNIFRRWVIWRMTSRRKL